MDQLRHGSEITRAKRNDCLLLILALAYILLLAIGLHAQRHYTAGLWCSSNRPDQCSLFTIGRILLDRLHVSPATAFAALANATS